MFNKNLKTKRGFSLVELMVVVAIMGTLAAIAIPAYNEYRKTAKKGVYKADLTSLHKGWLAFGVELDNFCERETAPASAAIEHVGMVSLLSSKLYGDGSARCSVGTHATQANCTGAGGIWTAATTGPGKNNFIGFGTIGAGCSATGTKVEISASTTTIDPACDLTESTYDMGVYGHLSGDEYHGAQIQHTGVFAERAAVTVTTPSHTPTTTCS